MVDVIGSVEVKKMKSIGGSAEADARMLVMDDGSWMLEERRKRFGEKLGELLYL